MNQNNYKWWKNWNHWVIYSITVTNKKSENEKQTKSDDCPLNEKSKNLDSADISIKIKPFHLKVYGIQLIIHNPQHKKSLIITGTVDDIMIDFLNNKYVNLYMKRVLARKNPERGDVVVFAFPEDTTKDFVKRCEGLQT